MNKRSSSSTSEKPAKMQCTTSKYNKEIVDMLKCFNCTDLISLMQFAQKSKSGRKADLVERALNLVKEGCSLPITIKIKEIYNQHNARLQSANSKPAASSPPRNTNVRTVSNNRVTPKTKAGNFLGRRSRSSSSTSSWTPDDLSDSVSTISTIPPRSPSPLSPPVLISDLKIKIKKPVIEKEQKHDIKLTAPIAGPSRMPVHSDVRMLPLPFYNHISQLVKPSTLAKVMFGLCSSIHSFHLSPGEVDSIEKSKLWHADGVMEYRTQVLLRFALAEITSEQDDHFPPRLVVTINNKIPALPAFIPATKAGVEPKRPGRPVNITQLCKLNAYERNVISVKWEDIHVQNFCLSVDIAKHLSSSDLLQRLKQTGPRLPDHTKALIKEKMKASNDNEISATSLRISLTCPLSKMRLSLPVRSNICSHLQCFDASTFIQMNEKKPSWMCPVCDRPAKFDTLFIDGLFVEILSKVTETNDIQFTEDGEWVPMFPRKTEKQQKSTEKKIHLVSDSPEPCLNMITTIDLTKSDDEDEEDNEDALTTVSDDLRSTLTKYGFEKQSMLSSFFDQL